MAFDPDQTYYTNMAGVEHGGPYTPRQLSKIPTGKIGSIMFVDVDGMTSGLMDVKVIWVDDVALYLEVQPEEDILIPWGNIMWIDI